MFIDFKELRATISIDRVVDMLGVTSTKHGDQLRSACPIHKGPNQREFVITPSKGLWHCFKSCGGGDAIALVAKVKGIEQKAAAQLIAKHFKTMPGTAPPATRANEKTQSKGLVALDYLQAENEHVQGLSISAETATAFKFGFATKGTMRGRFCVPCHGKDGTLLAYCGIAVLPETSPRFLFPSNFDPTSIIWNAHNVQSGDLYLVRDILAALQAFQNGMENVCAFLTDTITAGQLVQLSALMDEKQIDSLEIMS
jgi:hypothetical protein